MKKALLLGLMLVVALALAAPASAIDWSARGAINIMAAYYKNIDLRVPIFQDGPPGTNNYGFGVGAADPAWNEENAWTQLRTEIFITARANENLSGTWGFEIDSTRWGDNTTGANSIGAWNADQIAVEVKDVFIDFKVPQIPVWVRAGIQNFQVRRNIFFLLDGAGVSARIPLKIDPVTVNINPFWGKAYEGLDHTDADDWDVYGIDVNVDIGAVKPGVAFIYQALRQLYDGTVPAVEGDSKQWWIAPYVDVQIGPVAATLDFVYNGGVEDFQGASPLSDIDHEGWIIRGEASYTLNKFRFGLGALYGTGDDPTTNDDEGYNVPYHSEASACNTDFLIVFGDWGLFAPYGATNNIVGFFKPWSTPGQGVWYVRGFVDYQITDWLKLMANTGYIGDTVDDGDQFGTDADDDDTIGWEIDVGAQVKIYRNLVLSTAFGYLIGGNALNMGPGDEPQDPWAWVTTLSFFF